jgi:hypothetical protein
MKKLLLIATALILSLIGPATGQQPNQTPRQKTDEAATAEARQRASEPQRGQSRRDRSITGRVIDDAGQPIEGAFIMMTPAGLTNIPQGPAMMAKLRFISTDEDGKFAADNLSPGAYKMMIIVSGYVPAPDADVNPDRKYYRPGDSVTLRMIKGGVITGTVTSLSGEPVIGVRVRPVRVRDLKGRPVAPSPTDMQQEWKTDDRGIYRIYGLDPGVYVMAAGGKGLLSFVTGAYDSDAPTYYPSATRDTATEIPVHSGEEIMGVDIRYRDQRAHAITGTVTTAGATASNLAVATVILTDASNKAVLGFAITPLTAGSHKFAFDAVSDGEYVVTALSSDYTSGAVSHRIAIKGADATGIDLLLTPFSSIEGTVALERAPAANPKDRCEESRPSTVEEIVVLARQGEKAKDKTRFTDLESLLRLVTDANPNDKGEFKAGMLEAARYRLDFRLPTENWYVRSITLPAEKAGGPPRDAARDGFALKPGEHLKAVTVTVSEGAARLRGRLAPASEGARLPDRLRVHLIPAEKESADDLLRYYEARVEADDSFIFSNLAPGKYRIVARPSESEETNDEDELPLAWNDQDRRKLRGQAEQADASIEFQRCQRIGNYVLKYAPLKKVADAPERKPQ